MSVTWGRRLVASLLAALTVAVGVHVATVFAFFFSNQFTSAIIGSANSYFSIASLIGFVIIFALALAGGLRVWFTAVPAGLVAGIIAGIIGLLIPILQGGQVLDGSVVAYLFGTLLGVNTIFILLYIVFAATLGRLVYNAVLRRGASARANDRRIAIVRMPASTYDDGVVTHLERVPVDADKVDEQWDAYVKAFEANGWTTSELPFADGLPDSVFVEDVVALFGDLAVITRPALESRAPEVEGIEANLRDFGLRVQRIEAPGTLEGGDILTVGDTVYVGRSDRTNAEGVRQLRGLLAPLGYVVVAVPVTKVLHLKTAVTALPDGTVIGYEPLVDDVRLFDRFRAVPEPEGSAVVVLSDDTVLLSAAAPQTATLIEDLGFTVVRVDISEFEKREGCVTCLSVRVR